MSEKRRATDFGTEGVSHLEEQVRVMDLGTVRVYEADPVLIVVLDEAELRIVFTVTRDVEVAFIY